MPVKSLEDVAVPVKEKRRKPQRIIKAGEKTSELFLLLPE